MAVRQTPANRPSTVGAIARLAGVTVRTLHHYDEIGLVVPGRRTGTGYRLYGSREVVRLQEVLFFRELGFRLDEIKQVIDRPGYTRAAALEHQRALLESKAERLQAMIDAIDLAIDAQSRGAEMTNEDMLEVFGEFDPSEYEEEARRRWGGTDAYRESARRTAGYAKEDWQQIGRESDEINAAFVALMEADRPADGEAAMDVAERHRAHISKWFYECSREVHAGLGQMYVTDQRFTDSIDRTASGLARYMSDAIAANARR